MNKRLKTYNLNEKTIATLYRAKEKTGRSYSALIEIAILKEYGDEKK